MKQKIFKNIVIGALGAYPAAVIGIGAAALLVIVKTSIAGKSL